MLKMHLADPKAENIRPARRLRTGRKHGPLEQLVEGTPPAYPPPVTLIIGPVGAGKSTYLAHFERVAAADLLREKQAHWIYVDYEKMGISGSPRDFLYQELMRYINADHPSNPTDFKAVIEPAYRDDIASLAKGPLAPIRNQEDKFNQKISEFIETDYNRVEPYVDKVFSYMASTNLAVVVLDNVDLYENDQLESAVFSEGLAFSKRVHCHVIVCIRDTTFVRHRTGSIFDAYELRKLWLDPPPFRRVLSARLEYSKKILENKRARIPTEGGANLDVPDLGLFFEVVQRSILDGEPGHFVDAVADTNIRKGLTLVTNFLTSGHIQADKALSLFLSGGDRRFHFPFHEVFKGGMLGQWRHFKEDRTDCVNLFDARVGARRLRLLRLHLLKYLMLKARRRDSLEVPLQELVDHWGVLGAAGDTVENLVLFLRRENLIRHVSVSPDRSQGTVAITRSGGYYVNRLCLRFVYVEECMHDTAIDEEITWNRLSEISYAVESENSVQKRMQLREERLELFTSYLVGLEQEVLSTAPFLSEVAMCHQIKEQAMKEVAVALRRSRHSS